MPLLRAQPEACRRQPEQRAVVEHEALVVAPCGVMDAAGPEPGHVAQRDAVEIGFGIRTLDPVFGHRRDVEERRLAADGEIFELLVPQRMRRAVAGPVCTSPASAPSASMRGWNGVPSRSVRKCDCARVRA
ncbi:MAG: hypothetical protein QM771_11270 [Nitrospira sp.]